MVDAGPAGEGQGLMFRHAGNCYVATARHVTAGLPQLTIKTEDPISVGNAFAFTPFWSGLDLAVATARYGIEDRCTVEFETLKRTNAFSQNAEGDLVRIQPSGQVERVRMRVVNTRYLDFDAVVVNPSNEIYQGTSGAFFYVEGVPVGMAVEAADSQTARFVRIEEIAMNLDRWLTGRGAAFSAGAASPEIEQEAGFSVRLAEATMPPISPEYAADNVLSNDTPFIFEQTSNMRLVFEVLGEDNGILRRIRIKTGDEHGQSEVAHAVPRQIIIEIDPTRNSSNPIRKWSGQMGPDGILDTGPIAPSYVRTITVRILDAWTDGPIQLNTIEFF
jgi:hypothetical protein